MSYEMTPGLEGLFDATPPFVDVEKETTTAAPGVRENSQPTKERKEVEDSTKVEYARRTGELLDAIRKAAIGDDKRDDKKPPLAPGQKKPLSPDKFGPAA